MPKRIDPHPCCFCGKETANPRFCSTRCAGYLTNKEAPRKHVQKIYPSVPCTLCGEMLPTRRQGARKDVHKVCLYAEKRNEFLVKWVAGELTPTQVASGTKHSRRLTAIARRILLDRCNGKCEKCGWSEINPFTGRVPLETDHINGNPYDDRYGNFRVLCPNCHALTATHKGANRGFGRGTERTLE